MAVTWVDNYRRWRYAAFRWRYELSIPRKIALALVFAGVTGLVAQIRFGGPVPITGQTFAVLLAGVLLGRWWGGISLACYVGIGAAGVPWFAPKAGMPMFSAGGLSHLTGATGGYLLGFILAALFLGFFVDRYINSRKFLPMLGLMLFANYILIYAPGLLWLNAAIPALGGFGSYLFWWNGFIKFIAGDAIKVAAAAGVTKAITPKEMYNGEVDQGRIWRIP